MFMDDLYFDSLHDTEESDFKSLLSGSLNYGVQMYCFKRISIVSLVLKKKCVLNRIVSPHFQGEIPLQGDFSAEHMIFGGW